MVFKQLKTFDVRFLQVLNEHGECDKTLMPKLEDEEIKRMYELMVLARVFDDKCLNLQRQGRMGTYAPVRGQEASQIGSALALSKEDWLVPSFRESAALIARGTPMYMLMQYWAGDERGSKVPSGINNLPISIPVGTQIPHAVGLAYAAKYKNHEAVALVYLGDGATSKGDFHESLNMAGVLKTPTIFLCQNNQYAISLPRSKQTASETLAQKSLAYGFEGVQVDGNDIFAVYKATKEAVERARKENTPALIECFTYRVGDHTTADDASRYRSKEELDYWVKRDPIERLRNYMKHKSLFKKSIWNEIYGKKVQDDAVNKVEAAVKEMESQPPLNPEDIFLYTYKNMPEMLHEQMEELLSSLKEREIEVKKK